MELEQVQNIVLENNKKEDFLNSTLWKTINNGIDIGLRFLLPDIVEDEIINIKDNLINFGLKDGIKKSIDNVIETGKQALGIFSGNFQDIGQLQSVIKNGGVIDKVSTILDTVINKANDAGKISNEMGSIIKNGKSAILSSVERNIEKTLNDQISNVKLVDKYINNWKEYYNKKDFDGMEREYEKIKLKLKDLAPLENTLNNANYVENLHTLIKNNGKNFNLSEEELELVNKFSEYK